MAQIQTTLPILPAANDQSLFYVSMQPKISGLTYNDYVSSNLTFNPNNNQLNLNGAPVNNNITTTSGTAPLNPVIGDTWYDTSTDITFQYTFDGESNIWVDVSSAYVPTDFTYRYVLTVPNNASQSFLRNTAITNLSVFNSVTGGIGPYVYSVSSGTLPTGITLNSVTGVISGTPTVIQNPVVTFKVTDSNGVVGIPTSIINFVVNYPSLVATPSGTTSVTTTSGTAISSFYVFSSVSGGSGSSSNYVYSIVSGTLPTGITMDSTGYVSGTPTTSQSLTNVTFKVTDSVTNESISRTIPFTVLFGFSVSKLNTNLNAYGTGIAIANNRYVIVGTDQNNYFKIQGSNDGNSWLAASAPYGVQTFNDRSFGVAANTTGFFSVVGSDIYTGNQRGDSAGGTDLANSFPSFSTFTGGYTNSATIYDPINAKWITVGNVYSAPYYIGYAATSTTGSSYSGGTLLGDNTIQFLPQAIACNNTGYTVAVGYGSNNNYPYACLYNGSSWTTPTTMGGTTTASWMRGVANNNSGLWVSVGYIPSGFSPLGAPVYSTSTDGVTWAVPAYMNGSTANAYMTAVTFTASAGFVAVGYDGSNIPVYATSSNGNTWTTPARINGTAQILQPTRIIPNPTTGGITMLGYANGSPPTNYIWQGG